MKNDISFLCNALINISTILLIQRNSFLFPPGKIGHKFNFFHRKEKSDLHTLSH